MTHVETSAQLSKHLEVKVDRTQRSKHLNEIEEKASTVKHRDGWVQPAVQRPHVTKFSYSVSLAKTFCPKDILAFHRRDPQAITERVTDNAVQKGIMWHNMPTCLLIHFHPEYAEAHLLIDGQVSLDSQVDFAMMIQRMLGLTQEIEKFEAYYRDHPQLGSLITRQSGLRVPITATPFEALTWAIMGQQISMSAALSLRRKLIMATNISHSNGLFCYPAAHQIAMLTEAALRQIGFSMTKARTLLTLSQLVVDNKLPFDIWMQTLPIPEIQEQLKNIRGIGLWTVNYALLRGFGWLDGSLHGDAAVRRGLQVLLNSSFKISEAQTQSWLAEFSPWRALVAAHLWAAQSSVIDY